MKKELKICLPLYKIIYSFAFILILSLIRGIVYIEEIGIAMEKPIALLSIIMCADVYLAEVYNKRREVFKLYSLKRQSIAIYRRFLILTLYLLFLSTIGYGLFYSQKPVELGTNSSLTIWIMFMISMICTILFWSMLSITISNFFRSVWIGIGCSLLLWLELGSESSNRILGSWNIFSYTFRNIEAINDWSWLNGKGISILLAVLMIVIVPTILRKRG